MEASIPQVDLYLLRDCLHICVNKKKDYELCLFIEDYIKLCCLKEH